MMTDANVTVLKNGNRVNWGPEGKLCAYTSRDLPDGTWILEPAYVYTDEEADAMVARMEADPTLQAHLANYRRGAPRKPRT